MATELAFRIMFMSGPEDGREINIVRQIEGEGTAVQNVTIGRRESCDVTVPFDTLVSRLHATVIVRADSMTLVDEDSRNGTFIGMKRLSEPVPIAVGQLFRVGRTWLRIQNVMFNS